MYRLYIHLLLHTIITHSPPRTRTSIQTVADDTVPVDLAWTTIRYFHANITESHTFILGISISKDNQKLQSTKQPELSRK
jgi:hypothetical protein